jgi:predicted RNase H-like nuclease (RuvC/YqgF family)
MPDIKRYSEYNCKECAYRTFKKANYTRHLSSNKHTSKKRTTRYFCKICSYQSQLKGDYTKHLLTNKHKLNFETQKPSQKEEIENDEKEDKQTIIDLKSELYDFKKSNKYLEEDNKRLNRENRRLFKEMCGFRKELNLRKAGLK